MYAVIVDHDGAMWWYGAYDDREYADNLAKDLGGRVAILHHPLYKEPGDYYGTEL